MSHRNAEVRQTGNPRFKRSAALYRRACRIFPDGVTRATISREPHPTYIDFGKGCYLFDVDGNRYLDFANNFTTLIHGHQFAPVCRAVVEQVNKGTCFASPTEAEVELAELLERRVPSIERIRFVNTGTEAVMFAIKAARALTGRPAVAKLEGAYHGAYDWAEVSESSSPQQWGDARPASVPFYRGVPESVLNETVVLATNDIALTREALNANRERLACILIDVMPSRAGLSPVDRDYLSFLRAYATRYGMILISDEVLNFRQSFHGAAERFGIAPDLFALGKIIGGGLPIGAIAGSEAAMSVFGSDSESPRLPQGGTFSANPLSMVAGIASLRELDRAAFDSLEQMGRRLRRRLRNAARGAVVPLSVSGQASLFRIHPTATPPTTYREAYQSPAQSALMRRLSRFLLEHGVFMPSNGPGALSTPMSEDDVDAFVELFAEFARTPRLT